MIPREPTSRECSDNTSIPKADGTWDGFAIFYPQMGGYGGAVVVPNPGSGCFDAYVWHDGEFPFGGESEPGRAPAVFHHCDPEQFVRFGETVAALMKRSGS